MYQEDFRNLIFDLAFGQYTQTQDMMLQYFNDAAEKLQAVGKSPALVSQELFNMQAGKSAANQVRRLKDFKAEAFARTTANQQNLQSNTEWRSLQEKGLLLYRDVKFVRTNFDNVSGGSKKPGPDGEEGETMQETLISLYLKEDQVNIEVFLYNDE